MKLKKLLLALILILAAQTKATESGRTIFVYSDSTTSPRYSWAEFIDYAGYAHVKNYSRGGIKLTEVTIPNWLRCNDRRGPDWGPDTVIIWLGNNDIFKGEEINKVEKALHTALKTSTEQGCDTYIILPLNINLSAFIEMREVYRQVVAKYSEVTLLDMPYDTRYTLEDGIHQNGLLHLMQARYIIEQLNLNHTGRQRYEQNTK